VYTDALVQVCEGQALDKEFESRRDVTLGEYFRMIGEKTGRIITASAEIGAIVGGGSPGEVSALRSYGKELGIAFQVQDDLLDITGQEEKFGKKIGGDIIEGKKTYLLLKALERATGADRAMLRKVAPGRITERSQIERVREIYHETGTLVAAGKVIARSTHLAEQSLQGLPDSRAKGMLLWLSRQLLERSS
jgi:geranylgeranyl diphosphate synthase type II